MTEYVDVVNKNDHPTGEKIDRDVAHTKAVLHRVAVVFVFDGKGQLYIQKHWSGLLDHTVGGHVSAGEDYFSAAKREAAEEINLEEPLKLVALGVYADETHNRTRSDRQIKHMFGIYECQPSTSWHFLANEEVTGIFPLPIDQIVKQMTNNPSKFTQGFIYTLAKYIEVKGLSYDLDVSACLKNWKDGNEE